MDKLLTYFMENPEKEYYVRELAVLINKSPTTISKYCHALFRKKVLLRTKKLHHLLFKANNEHPSFKQRKLEHNLRTIQESGVINELVEIYNHPGAIILFGSFARAENIPRSDVDLLIITPLKKKMSLTKFEKRLRHGIQLFEHSVKEIDSMKKKNKELLNNWVNGIVLYGHWELFR
jgi:predicted nucleotidyltransferase